MNSDSELLRCYLEEKSEAAFREIVQRHVGLVYSVALRRVGGDAHLAEDVAQTVFNDLARKAPTLRHRATLGGWLYASAHVASAAVVRSEQRRKAREFTAHDMQTTNSPAEADPDWAQLRPVIDDAIVALKDEEREAVALRFFEKQSFAEIGATLRVTEDAARKRVDRALEKLRVALARHGVTSTAAALGVTLTMIAATSAPLGLGAKVAGQAIATAGAAGSGATLGGWLGLSLPTAAAIAIGSLVVSQHGTNDDLRRELSQFTADRAALAALQKENRALEQNLAAVRTLRTAAAQPLPDLPRQTIVAPPAPPPARPIAGQIFIRPEGTVRWNDDYLSLAEFVRRMQQAVASADPGSRIHVRTDGSTYSAVMYIVDEARKAGVDHLTVESIGKPKPDDKFAWWWF